MNITCADRERIFLDGTEEEWAELDAHAATCAECGTEVRGWKALSLAAEELRDYEESSALWQRIEGSLRAKAEKETPRQTLWERLAIWRNVPLGWQAALTGALVLALSISGWYLGTHRAPKDAGAAGRLLKSDALQKVEEAERAYVQAIDKLAMDAKPQLDDAASPLMASYREKLMVIDSAIDELRAQAGQNPSNAHLRNQLLAMYQEKKETLQEVLETER
jgi:hypothetical protein